MKLPTKYQYNELILRLEECVNFYKNTKYKFSEIKLYLSNGEVLEFKFTKKAIPHLLGINIANLRASRILDETDPFSLLEELINRSVYVYQKMESGVVKYGDIFNAFTEEKISVFKKVLQLKAEDIVFACEYDKSRSYINGERNNYGCDYYVALEDADDKFIYLGLKKYENSKYDYCPSSIVNNFDKESNDKVTQGIIGNQPISIVNNVRIDNIGINFYTSNDSKLLLAQRLTELCEEYGSFLIISKDYIYNMKKLLEKYESESKTDSMVRTLTSAIVQNKAVSQSARNDAASIGFIYRELIDTYNNSIKTEKDSRKLIKELQELRTSLDTVLTTLQEKDAIIEKLNGELESLRSFKSESFQLFKKYGG